MRGSTPGADLSPILSFEKLCHEILLCRYLIEQKADVAAVNNDGELAIDISESDEMEELLQKEIDAAGIDCEA